MVNVCALRCIGKETRRNRFTSQNLEKREREKKGGDKMKDNKTIEMQMLKASMPKQHFLVPFSVLSLSFSCTVEEQHQCVAFGSAPCHSTDWEVFLSHATLHRKSKFKDDVILSPPFLISQLCVDTKIQISVPG